jgi:hypothetical protein
MKGEQEPTRVPQQPTLAQRDLAEGRWRGMWFYTMTAMRERYGPDAGKPPPAGTERRRSYNPPTDAPG